MSAAPPAFAPGSLVGGRYRLRALIGQGGMGAVYEAVDEARAATVALKLLAPAIAGERDRAARVRFEREVLSAQRIAHPSIVRVLGSGHDGDRPFVAMERLHGEDLHARLASQGPLAPELAVEIACEIGGALQAAHDAGIVHRDLKPRNVFLPDRGAARAKVLDFGVAKWLGALALTGPTQSFGTPAFMAPEQLKSSAGADARSDVYALGATLFAMLTARAPFEAGSEVELYMMVMNDPPADPRAHCPTLPAPLVSTVARALAKQPAERFASAAALVDALRAR